MTNALLRRKVQETNNGPQRGDVLLRPSEALLRLAHAWMGPTCMEAGVGCLRGGRGRGAAASSLPGQASRDRQVARRGVGAWVGYEGAFWERTSCRQSLARCLASAGRAALTGRLQSPERQRDEAACAWEDARSGQGVTTPRRGWLLRGCSSDHRVPLL